MRSPLGRLSLQTRLLISFAIVIVLATAAGYLFINRSVNRAFSDFTVRSFTMQDQIMVQLIVAYYAQNGSLEGLVDLLNRDPRGTPILLVDPDRRVVYAPEERYVGRRLDESQLREGQAITLPTGEIWTLVPYRSVAGRDELESAFLRTTRRAMWLAGSTAGLAGLFLALFLLRQTTNPLRQLEAATRRIATGHLDERVEVRSSDEIARLARSFNEMAESLQAGEQTQRRLIADISHELRTPLTAVRSALEGLRDGLIDPTEATFAALHDRILLLTRLVNDLHQLALADAGQLSIQRRPTRLQPIVDGIVETVGAQVEDVGLILEEQVDADLPALDIDPQRIEQVLLNLLSNAIRHTPQGGRILLRAERNDNIEAVVTVCDSGPGLPPEELPHVFDRFYQADPARAGGGAGLGLSIARALVEAHGGRIWAENLPEGGACFSFTLPLAA
jgi:two-component system sensor histidine kinase BaeS